MIEITVHSIPAPQGSKRFVGLSKAGRGILIESSRRVKPWRSAVVEAAEKAMNGLSAGIKGPVEVEMIFTMPKPKSAPKRTRSYPDKKPDLSKLVRSTEDALKDAGAFEDDARIIRCLAAKVFPGEGRDSLPVPGVVIRITGVRGDAQPLKAMIPTAPEQQPAAPPEPLADLFQKADEGPPWMQA